MAQNGIMTVAQSSDSKMHGRFPSGIYPGSALSDVNMAIQGHSLFTHDDGTAPNAPADDYTRAGNWMGLISDHVSNTFRAGGNFYQMDAYNTQWSSTWVGPPASGQIQYSFTSTGASFYPSGTFGGQGFTHFMMMTSNFEQQTDTPAQWQARTLELIDNIIGEDSDIEMIGYIHWSLVSDAGSFVDNTDLTSGESTTYWAHQRGDYLTWHMDLYNAARVARPSVKMRFLPIGAILGDLIENESYMSTVVWTDIFGDSSPHGTQTCYLLAGLITWIALYRTTPDLTGFSIPVGATQVISEVSNNLNSIAAYVADRLAYYDQQGRHVY